MSMKRKVLVLLLTSTLLSNCGSVQNVPNKSTVEVVSGEKDPIMKLLVSGLILLSLNLMITR